VPLWLLYEISISIAARVNKEREDGKDDLAKEEWS
jgi:Sec-independent protein secretion pathway component TatC